MFNRCIYIILYKYGDEKTTSMYYHRMDHTSPFLLSRGDKFVHYIQKKVYIQIQLSSHLYDFETVGFNK